MDLKVKPLSEDSFLQQTVKIALEQLKKKNVDYRKIKLLKDPRYNQGSRLCNLCSCVESQTRRESNRYLRNNFSFLFHWNPECVEVARLRCSAPNLGCWQYSMLTHSIITHTSLR